MIFLIVIGYLFAFLIVFVASAAWRIFFLDNAFRKYLKTKWNSSIGSCYKDLHYGTGEFHKYDLYIPATVSGKTNKLVVMIHGGGFTGGDKKGDASWCKYFVSKGYTSATINYTTHSEEHPSNVKKMSDEILEGVIAINEECTRLGIDLQEMAITGGSAGGCLALLYAFRDYNKSPIPVKFVFEEVGPTGFDPEDWSSEESNDVVKAVFCSFMTGVNISAEMVQNGEHRKYIAEISPYCHVTPTSVPALFAYGVWDKVVPIRLKDRLVKALDENGVPYDYFEFPRSGHALHADPKQARAYMKKMDEYLEQYL